MPKYMKKQIVIDAQQWNGEENISISCRAFDDYIMETTEGIMPIKIGDFIVKGIDGEVYVCDKSRFLRTYDLIGK